MAHVVFDEADTLFDDTFSPGTVPFLAMFKSQPSPIQMTLVGATIPTDLTNILKEIFPAEELEEVNEN